MENIDYKTAIQAQLQYLPEQYLAHLYQIIQLMASPFKETKTVDKETLQAYADTFRKGFKLLMKKELGLNVFFQIEEKYTLLKLNRVAIEEEKQGIESAHFDLESILKKNNLALIEEHQLGEKSIKYKIRILDVENNFKDNHAEKAIIFDHTEGIYLLDTSEPKKWAEEQSIIDRKYLIGLMFQNLPTYS